MNASENDATSESEYDDLEVDDIDQDDDEETEMYELWAKSITSVISKAVLLHSIYFQIRWSYFICAKLLILEKLMKQWLMNTTMQ